MRSIRRRLWTGLVLGLALLWLATATGLYFTVRYSLLARFDAQLQVLVSEVRLFLPEAAFLRMEQDTRRTIDFFIAGSGYYFQIWGPDDVFSDRSPSLGDTELPRPAAFATEPVYWDAALSSGEAVRACAVYVEIPLGTSGDPDNVLGANVVVARNREELDQMLSLVIGGSAALGILMALGCGLVVHYTVRVSLAPLDRLGEQAARIDTATLATRFSVDDMPNELQPITRRLNDLLGRLESGFERERRFSADLAHELRTPLAELKTVAEYALTWPDEAGEHTFREVVGTADRMAVLLNALLTMARLESHRDKLDLDSIQVDNLLADCWRGLADQAKARELRIEWAVPTGLTTESNGELLRVIVSNLLSNAIEYTPRGGLVRVECRASPRVNIDLAVTNATNDLKPADLPYLFDRLWRRDPARSGANHHGLGLSLSKACAEALGYQLSAALDEARNLLTIRLNNDSPGRQREDQESSEPSRPPGA